MKTRWIGWLAVGGLSVLFLAAGALTPARADGDDYGHPYLYRHVAFDRDGLYRDRDVRRDEFRLHELYRARDREVECRDWHDVRRIDARIANIRADIRHDIHADRRHFD